MCLKEGPERKLLHFGSKSIELVHLYRYLGSPINTLGNATEAISGGIANGHRQLLKIGPILRSSVLAALTKGCLLEIFTRLQEDIQSRGAGQESSSEMPSCYNTAKVPEPMDWAEQTDVETNEKTTRCTENYLCIDILPINRGRIILYFPPAYPQVNASWTVIIGEKSISEYQHLIPVEAKTMLQGFISTKGTATRRSCTHYIKYSVICEFFKIT
ncbi:unnamed protein product [Hymenolepis diminuta]|uniref:Uncharacterized protein n=1 Tax=Hymenolepis diminuta TaxID=6216 RepID=A0A564ZAV9_HYMDI|nr:unnamed protein product [Hymenolepis diminuta]